MPLAARLRKGGFAERLQQESHKNVSRCANPGAPSLVCNADAESLVSGQMFSEQRFFARGTLLRILQLFTRPIRGRGKIVLEGASGIYGVRSVR